jgi:hypothetical protein
LASHDPLPAVAPTVGSLWHFSDLHFGPVAPGRPQVRARPQGVDEDTLSQDPFGALIEFARRNPADLLVLSGDFVNAAALAPESAPPGGFSAFLRSLFSALAPPPPHLRGAGGDRRDEAYTVALKFIERLAEALGVPPGRIIVCPGNHDVDKETAGQNPARSADAFYAMMERYVHPRSPVDRAAAEALGLKILCLDTARLCHVRFSEPQVGAVPRDAPAYPLKRIDELLEEYADASGAPAEDLLGIVVAHHPPSIPPTSVPDLQPYDVAIGAAQAKRRLASAGFQVFFHGHKHIHVVHEERVHSADRRDPETLLIVGSSPLLDSQGSPGFNRVRFAVSRGCGDARILVQPYTLEGGVPTPRRPAGRFAVRSRVRAPAALIRVAEQINVHGDSRTRIEFHEIPLPAGDTPEGGWEKDGDQWIRVFGRLIQVPFRQASMPRLFGLTPHTHPHLRGVDGDAEAGTRRFRIHVAAPFRAGQTDASFCELSVTNTTYGVSLDHQRRLWGRPEGIPGLETGWESLSYVVRDPADRLEITIDMPFATEGGYRARVRTYVEETPQGPLKSEPELLDFCRFHLKENSEAARLEVSVEKPQVGVVYSLEWKLPKEHPFLTSLGRGESRKRYFDALRVADRLRDTALRRGYLGDRSLEELAAEHANELLAVLREAGAAGGGDLEWCIFVPQQKLWQSASGESGDVPHPVLVPVFASFSPGDPRWDVSWRAGYGMAGRAYATNSVVRYVREERDSPEPATSWGDDLIAETYAVLDGLPEHEVLYAIPVRHPTRVEGDVVWGVLCLGTYGSPEELSLDGTIEWSRLGVEGGAGDAAIGVAGSMMAFGQKLLATGTRPAG